MFRKVIITAAAIIALGVAAVPTDASAYWRGGGWNCGYGVGWGYSGGGFAAGAILGGLLAAPYYYGPPRGYYYGPPPGDAVAYCMRRFRSYDPRSGTYLGYDGYRHPCP
jgi:hypothetical protein